MTLCEKYKPKTLKEIKGQDLAVQRINSFIKKFPEKKVLILHGPTGTGKTCLAHALCKETNSEILEINASDLRNREQIEKIIGEASQQKSLFSKTKILLVDEIDGINKDDFGGLPELIKLIEETAFPIIITANNIWDKKFSELRRKSELVQLKDLSYQTIFNIIKGISETEKLNLNDDILKSIAIKARGDARAAINDLQTIDNEIKTENIHERDKEDNIFNVLNRIFKAPTDNSTMQLYDTLSMPLDEIFLWLEKNIPLEYKGEELAKAFYALSKADVFRGRIYRQQHWRFLVYQNLLMSAGVSASKKEIKKGFTIYEKPDRILKIWLINQKTQQKKSIAEKYAKLTHTGKKRALKDFNIIKYIIKNPDITQKLNLTEQEIEFLKG